MCTRIKIHTDGLHGRSRGCTLVHCKIEQDSLIPRGTMVPWEWKELKTPKINLQTIPANVAPSSPGLSATLPVTPSLRAQIEQQQSIKSENAKRGKTKNTRKAKKTHTKKAKRKNNTNKTKNKNKREKCSRANYVKRTKRNCKKKAKENKRKRKNTSLLIFCRNRGNTVMYY